MSATIRGPEDELASAQAKVERLLNDRSVRPLKRAIYGTMYRNMVQPVLEDLQWLIGRLEEQQAA